MWQSMAGIFAFFLDSIYKVLHRYYCRIFSISKTDANVKFSHLILPKLKTCGRIKDMQF